MCLDDISHLVDEYVKRQTSPDVFGGTHKFGEGENPLQIEQQWLYPGHDTVADHGQHFNNSLSDSAWPGIDNFDTSQTVPADGLHDMMFDSQAQETLPFEDFFTNNGGWKPPKPCVYCKMKGFECFMLRTTEANPNPITSCSSCVALFRQCSLAERPKRNASGFETFQPVIGQLHGVNEEANGEALIQGDPASAATTEADININTGLTSARRNRRSVKKTRVLRNWYTYHQEHPYPTEEEKVELSQESGMSKSQVTNWFSNARRRQRLSERATRSKSCFPQGSPMPRSFLSGLSPMDRWRNSPPEDEAASASAISKALGDFVEDATMPYGSDNTGTGFFEAASSAGWSSDSYQPFYMGYDSSSAGSLCHSRISADGEFLFSPSASSSVDDKPANTTPHSHKRQPGKDTSGTLQCTFCSRGFKKMSDWVRHERAVHMPGLDTFICDLPNTLNGQLLAWRVEQDQPECVCCGEVAPTDQHFKAHEIEGCREKALSERSFTRKDHLWQHLHKFHGCRKWEGWPLDLGSLQHSQDKVASRCGFCGMSMDSWKQRARHIASHFRSGLSMDQWVGGAGIGETCESSNPMIGDGDGWLDEHRETAQCT